MADEALQSTHDLDTLSFFGLHHWLGEISEILNRVDEASLAKAPSAEDSALIEQKDELVEAQTRLRRTMGSRLESPSLTKRERPLAEDFLKQQINKLEKGAAAVSGEAGKKAARALEKLRAIQCEVAQKKPVAETREVQEIEASIAAADADWKEVAPIYEKWEKGKHSFKTNADLQAMRRRYEDARKARDLGPARLQKALCSSREGKALAVPQEPGLAPGWSSASKQAAAPVRSNAPKAKPRTAKPSAWGSAVVSFAQRLRAEQVAQVRQSIEKEEEDEEGESEEEYEAPPPQAPPPRPKAAPPLPARTEDGFAPVKPGSAARPKPKPAPKMQAADDEEEDEPEAEEATPSSRQTGFTASAKKKGKAGKKKKGGNREDDDVPEPGAPPPKTSKPSGAAWMAAVEVAIHGSVLQELLASSAWRAPKDEEDAEQRMESLVERLSWVSPLGLPLPLEWKEFGGLQVDGGPKASSRRGTPEWVGRAQENVASFFAHYITILFGCILLHELSQFGLLLVGVIFQAVLILAPPDSPYLAISSRVLFLQGAHMLLWLLFLRSLYQMHFFVKSFTVLCVCGHAYIAVPLSKYE
jgi:hypothetical protein